MSYDILQRRNSTGPISLGDLALCSAYVTHKRMHCQVAIITVELKYYINKC